MVPMGIYSLIALGVLIVILLFIRFWPEKEPLPEPVAPQESTPPPNPIGTAATIGQRQLQQDLTGSALGDEGGLLLLADGRGQAGKIAAKLAIDTCLDLYQECPVMDKPQYYFRKAFQAANHKILSVLEDGRGATCLAAAIIQRGQLFYALVGDSRIALFRDGDLVPVTEGQTIDILAQHRYQQGRISKEQALKLLHERRLYNFMTSSRPMATGPCSMKSMEIKQPLMLRPVNVCARFRQPKNCCGPLTWISSAAWTKKAPLPCTKA